MPFDSDAGAFQVPGPAGASAFEAWRGLGNTGTVADFLAALRGAKGADSTVPGPQGEQGPAGAGTVAVRTASSRIAPWTAVIADGPTNCLPADPTNSAHRGLVIGVSAYGGAAGTSVEIQNAGDLSGPPGGFSVKASLCVGLNGALASNPPAGAVWRQLVATAVSDGHVVIALGEASRITDDADALIGSSGFAYSASDTQAASAIERGVWIDPLQATLGVSTLALAAAFGEANLDPVVVAGAAALRAIFYPICAFGFVGDGQSHPLSGVTAFAGEDATGWTLARWRTKVPQITSLADEIDTVAVQAWINRAGAKPCEVRLPPNCTWRRSFKVQSGVGDITLTGMNSNIQDNPGLAVGWEHGTAAYPALGRFYTRGRIKCMAGTSGAGQALLMRFSPNSAQDYTVSIHDLIVRNYGTDPIVCDGATRGIEFVNVQPFGPDFTVQPGNGIRFTGRYHIPGGFSFILYNCQAVNYETAYYFETYDHGALEGVQIFRSRGYTGRTLVKFVNHIFLADGLFYQPPIFYVTECDWQGTGPFVDFYGATNVRFTNNYLVFEINPAAPTGNPLYGYDLKACHEVICSRDNINILAGIKGLRVWHTDKDTRNTLLDRPTFNVQTTGDGSDPSYAPTLVQFDNNPLYPFTNIERGMVVEQAPPGIVYVNDIGNNQVSTTRARLAAPTNIYPTGQVSVDDYGEIKYSDKFEGTTDASGNLLIQFPPTLFRGIKTFEASNGDVSKTTSPCFPSLTPPPSAAGGVVRFPGITTPTPVRVNYTLTGV